MCRRSQRQPEESSKKSEEDERGGTGSCGRARRTRVSRALAAQVTRELDARDEDVGVDDVFVELGLRALLVARDDELDAVLLAVRPHAERVLSLRCEVKCEVSVVSRWLSLSKSTRDSKEDGRLAAPRGRGERTVPRSFGCSSACLPPS